MPGLDRLKRRLEAIPKAVRAAAVPALLESANEIAGVMRRLAEPSRDTGDLIESIAVTGPGQQTPPYSQPGGSMTVPENAVVITAGSSKARHVHFIEWGTAQAAAQPFFFPAYRLFKARAKRRISNGIRKAVRNTKVKT